jgi:hypothetical protein
MAFTTTIGLNQTNLLDGIGTGVFIPPKIPSMYVPQGGTIPIPTQWFMRAWDTVNLIWVFWTTYTPLVLPSSTLPVMSSSANLTRIAIVHEVESS